VYFNENIRDTYSYRQIEGEAEKGKAAGPSLLDVLKASKDD
jgi:hypothetical protein